MILRFAIHASSLPMQAWEVLQSIAEKLMPELRVFEFNHCELRKDRCYKSLRNSQWLVGISKGAIGLWLTQRLTEILMLRLTEPEFNYYTLLTC